MYAEGENNAEWLAMDVLSQAEHDTVAQAIFITPDEALLNAMKQPLKSILEWCQKQKLLELRFKIVVKLVLVKDRAEAIKLINQVAPEHLELCLDDAELMSQKLSCRCDLYGALYA